MKQLYIKFVLALFVIAISYTASVHSAVVVGSVSETSPSHLTGVVRDSVTNEPIPYASVSYEGKGVGSISDINGAYRITTRKGWNEVTFTAVGYKKKTVKIVPGVTTKLSIKLQSTDIQLTEIVVKPKKEKYSRKNNPAVELMKKVIEHKSSQRLEENDFYQFDKYQKLTTSINDVNPDDFGKGIYKKMPFLVNQVEPCLETNKLIIPFSVQETASQTIFRKDPKDEKTIIKGINTSGVDELFSTGDMMGTILKDVFTDVNIYDDDIRLLSSRFISPISSSSAISFYKFYIMDTLKVEKDSCIHLTFVPNNSQDFGFTGHLYILKDSTYAVKKCIMNLPKKTGVNFVDNLNIIQSYEQLPNGRWALKDDDMIVELSFVKNLSKLQVRRLTRYSNYAFNEIQPKLFKVKGNTVKEVDAMMKDDDFWNKMRPVPLTDKENGMDLFLKHLEEMPGFKYMIIGLKALIENFVETGSKGHPSKFDFGPMNTIIGSNTIEGLRLRISGQTTAKLFPQLFLSGYYAYGFKDNRSKYKGMVEYTFDKKEFLAREFPKHSISFSYMYDVMSPMDKFLKTDKDNMFVGLKTTTVDQMSYVRDAQFKYERETMSGFSVAMTVKNRNDEPTGNLFYIKNDEAKTNVHDITTTEASLQLRFAPGETFINTKDRRLPINFDAPIFTLSHTMGIKDVLGGDYKFNFTEAGVYKRFWLKSWGRLDAYVKAGKQWDKVPFPLLIMPAANLSYITQRETFNLINNMEFLNDKFASLDLTYDLNGRLFNRIPLIKTLKWREVFKFKALYGGLSDKNNPDLSSGLFLFPTRDGVPTSYAMGKQPYMEFSVGIYNIFKLLHIEYTRRLNYLDHPGINKDGIRLAVMLNF